MVRLLSRKSGERAAVWDLWPENYEMDEEQKTLLLKRLHPGTPTTVNDVL
jgi:hypothetical protein